MKKVLVLCMLLALALSLDGSSVWAVDVGWMQKGVRVWYFGAVGTTTSSDAEEAYLFKAVDGNNVQVTKHSAIDHWGTPNAADTGTYPFLDKGPCWIHPQKLQTLQSGDTWKGQVIATVLRESHTYNSFKAQFSFPYLLLPIKALFDLSPQRNLVKIVYYINQFSTGIAYFDADTGLLLLYETSNGFVTAFFLLSEINYDFATQRAFAEDTGPHTGFKSEAIETSTSGGANYVMIQSSVETRYGSTVQMWVSTSENSYSPPYENYCFFDSVPVLRRINMTEASNKPPEQWNAYGEYLWWWVPAGALQKSTINVFGVPMTRTGTNPYTFTATEQPQGVFYFTKLWFGTDGYMTAFSARDSRTLLNIEPGQTNFTNLTTVKGLNYYKNTMGIATPAAPTELLYASFSGFGLWKWDGSAWSLITSDKPQNMVASGATLYGDFGTLGLWKYDGGSWSQLTPDNPETMAASGSTLYASFGRLGLWKWNGSSWSLLTPDSPQNLVASGSIVYGDFGSLGLWKHDGTSWSRLTTDNPENMAASGTTLYVDFGPIGLWKHDGTNWSQLTSDNPESIAVSGSMLYGDFGTLGLWKWNGSSWTQLTTSNPENIVASRSNLYGDFGAIGLWKHDGTSWSQLTSENPIIMVTN
jgi:hypothetical protein